VLHPADSKAAVKSTLRPFIFHSIGLIEGEVFVGLAINPYIQKIP